MGTILFKENDMKIIKSAIVVVLLVGIGSGIVIANNANEGEGICITVTPKTLVLDNFSGDVTVHSNIAFSEVNPDSLDINGIAPYLVTSDDCGHLVAKFDADLVKAIVSPGQVTLTLSGVLMDGEPFTASDTITVK
jgi:hypothetical protein